MLADDRVSDADRHEDISRAVACSAGVTKQRFVSLTVRRVVLLIGGGTSSLDAEPTQIADFKVDNAGHC